MAVLFVPVVSKERINTDSSVLAAGCIARKRKGANSRVKIRCIVNKRFNTDSSVVVRGCVAVERRLTDGRVA